MTGGKIHIHGMPAWPGRRVSRKPASDEQGVIIVEGNAGNEVGAVMRRGLIVVMGDAGDFAAHS